MKKLIVFVLILGTIYFGLPGFVNNAKAVEFCRSYDYSEWSDCLNGQKTRTVISSYPSGCEIPSSGHSGDDGVYGPPWLIGSCSGQPSVIGDGTYVLHGGETVRLNNGLIVRATFKRNVGSDLFWPTYNSFSFEVFDPSSPDPDHIVSSGEIKEGTTEPIYITINRQHRMSTILNSLDYNNGDWTASVTFTSLYGPICTSFTYDDWSVCRGGTQYRLLLNEPDNCILGDPLLVRSCNSTHMGDGTYEDIGNFHNVILNNGANIYIKFGLHYTQNVDYRNKIFLSVKDSNGVDLTNVPNSQGAILVPDPVISEGEAPQDFNIGGYSFRASVNNIMYGIGTEQATVTLLSLNQERKCTSWTYTDWGNCINSIKRREIITRNPSGCTGGTPLLSQSCISNEISNIKTKTDQISPTIAIKANIKSDINADKTLAEKLSGKLLLDVENKGRVFYVNPDDFQKYEVKFAKALPLFRKLSLGITNSNLSKISETKSTVLGNRLKGKLLLATEDKGRIWYIDMNGLKHEVTSENLMDLFKRLSLGITNINLNKIPDGNL